MLKAGGLLAIGFVLINSFLRLDGGGASTTDFRPSKGRWDPEGSFEAADLRPNEPSVFMVSAQNAAGPAGRAR